MLERTFHSLVTVDFVVFGELVPHFWPFDALKTPPVPQLTPTKGAIVHGWHICDALFAYHCLERTFNPLQRVELIVFRRKHSILAVFS